MGIPINHRGKFVKNIFIVNPISGNGNYKEVIEWVHNHFKNNKQDYEVHITEYPGHAKEIASRFSDDVILYAVGGDGTAHEVLNGMNLNAQLAIIPSGTGNDFYRMISKDKTISRVLESTIYGQVKTIDIGKAAGSYFLNCLNLGIDARINLRVNNARSGFIPRKLSYATYALLEVMKKYAQTIDVTIDGVTTTTNALLASFMNGKWYGGGFMSGPFADYSDGLLEMSLVTDMPRWKIFKVLPKYFLGKHTDLSVVTYKQVNKVKVSSSSLIVMGVDGEVFEDYSVDIEVLPKALNLRVPFEQN